MSGDNKHKPGYIAIYRDTDSGHGIIVKGNCGICGQPVYENVDLLVEHHHNGEVFDGLAYYAGREVADITWGT